LIKEWGSDSKKAIDVTLALVLADAGSGRFDSHTFSRHRVSATILKRGRPKFDAADARLYGISESHMANYSSLGTNLLHTQGRGNKMTIAAGVAGEVLSTTYTGTLRYAYQDFSEGEDSCLSLSANSGGFDAVKPVPPISYRGSADVATIISNIAIGMGRLFENNGVPVILNNTYEGRTAIDQLHAVADAARIECYDDGETIATWPRGGTRGGTIPLISPATGLIGGRARRVEAAHPVQPGAVHGRTLPAGDLAEGHQPYLGDQSDHREFGRGSA